MRENVISFFHEQIGRRREGELEIFQSGEKKESSSEEISAKVQQHLLAHIPRQKIRKAKERQCFQVRHRNRVEGTAASTHFKAQKSGMFSKEEGGCHFWHKNRGRGQQHNLDFWHEFRERLLYKICTARTAKYGCSDTLLEVAIHHLMLS